MFSRDQGDMRIDMFHIGMLTVGNPSGFMNQFDVFFYKAW